MPTSIEGPNQKDGRETPPLMRHQNCIILVHGQTPGQILRDRILKEGTLSDGCTLRLSAFVNHQVDCVLVSGLTPDAAVPGRTNRGEYAIPRAKHTRLPPPPRADGPMRPGARPSLQALGPRHQKGRRAAVGCDPGAGGRHQPAGADGRRRHPGAHLLPRAHGSQDDSPVGRHVQG
eukprot:2102650-Prymnesium_polylepis.1